MYLMIRYAVGVVVEGFVLARGRNRMRVAVPGFADVLEFKRSGEGWRGGDGQAVEFDFLLAQSMSDRDAEPEIPAERPAGLRLVAAN